jgi:hypothetical protein
MLMASLILRQGTQLTQQVEHLVYLRAQPLYLLKFGAVVVVEVLELTQVAPQLMVRLVDKVLFQQQV